jgi:hypothetical protein
MQNQGASAQQVLDVLALADLAGREAVQHGLKLASPRRVTTTQQMSTKNEWFH